MFFIKYFMTLHTQSNPIIQISKIFFRFICPMNGSTFQTTFTTMLAGIWLSFPSSYPSVKRPVRDSISFPIPSFTSIFFSEISTLAIFTTSKTKTFNTRNYKNFLFTNYAFYLDFISFRKSPTYTRTEDTPIWSGFKGFLTLFTNFVNHKLSIT